MHAKINHAAGKDDFVQDILQKKLRGTAALLLKINYVQCCIKLLNVNLGGQPLQELVVLCNNL